MLTAAALLLNTQSVEMSCLPPPVFPLGANVPLQTPLSHHTTLYTSLLPHPPSPSPPRPLLPPAPPHQVHISGAMVGRPLSVMALISSNRPSMTRRMGLVSPWSMLRDCCGGGGGGVAGGGGQGSNSNRRTQGQHNPAAAELLLQGPASSTMCSPCAACRQQPADRLKTVGWWSQGPAAAAAIEGTLPECQERGLNAQT